MKLLKFTMVIKPVECLKTVVLVILGTIGTDYALY